MGDAKRRGSYMERKFEALAKQQAPGEVLADHRPGPQPYRPPVSIKTGRQLFHEILHRTQHPKKIARLGLAGKAGQ